MQKTKNIKIVTNNLELLEDIKHYSPFLDQLENDLPGDRWWTDGWYVVSTNITDTFDPLEGDEIKGIYLRTDEIQSQRKGEKTYKRFLILTEKGIVGVNEAKIMQDYSGNFEKGQILWFKFLETITSRDSGNEYRKYFVRAKDLKPIIKDYDEIPENVFTDFKTAKALKESEEEGENKPIPELMKTDDPEAQNMINNYTEIYKSNNYGELPTAMI